MEKIIRIVSMHRHHKYNQNRKQVMRQPITNYNHVINDLQDYMLYGKLLVQSLKTRSKMNTRHKIMTTTENSVEPRKGKRKNNEKRKRKIFLSITKRSTILVFFYNEKWFYCI